MRLEFMQENINQLRQRRWDFFFIYFLSFNAQVGNLRCDHRSGSQTLTPHSGGAVALQS